MHRLIPLLLASCLMAAEQPILLIAYGPFAGRGVNGSATVARSFEGTTLAGHPVVVAVRPGRWGAPEDQVPRLYAEHHPRLVLGLGEGFPDRVAIETRARNRRQHRDEAGAEPAQVEIEADGPPIRSSPLRIDPADLPPTGVPVLRSADAGTYLCNNLLWTCLAQADGPPAGFVHLPPQGDRDDDTYRAAFRPVVEAVLVQALGE